MRLKNVVALALVGAAAWMPAARAGDLLVAAAASLTNAFTDMGRQFQA
ncbi:MAG: molybdate ABC transporter substrate-binding protein, partial [Candidimonas sp.]